MNDLKNELDNFYKKYKFFMLLLLFSIGLLLMTISQNLIKDSTIKNATTIIWPQNMLEVMCGTNSDAIDFDEEFAWLYIWLGSMDARKDILDEVTLYDDSLAITSSPLKLTYFNKLLEDKLVVILEKYEKETKRRISISSDFDKITIDVEDTFKYDPDDYDLMLIRTYVLALMSLQSNYNYENWNLIIEFRDKDTNEILKKIQYPIKKKENKKSFKEETESENIILKYIIDETETEKVVESETEKDLERESIDIKKKEFLF